MQPLDQLKELLSLGLKLKKKRKQVFVLQPCPAHKDSCCSIYGQRPQRCRIFECRQLALLRCGEITEATAIEKISQAKALVARADELLALAGATNRRRSLKRRHQKVLDDVPDEYEGEPCESGAGILPMRDSRMNGQDCLSSVAAEPQTLRERLAAAMLELEDVLETDFRVK